MRNFHNHILILKSIADVRNELRFLADTNPSVLNIGPTLARLTSLYACLNVTELEEIIREFEELNKKKAA